MQVCNFLGIQYSLHVTLSKKCSCLKFEYSVHHPKAFLNYSYFVNVRPLKNSIFVIFYMCVCVCLYVYFYVFISLILFGGMEQFRKLLETLLKNGHPIRISSGYHLFFLKSIIQSSGPQTVVHVPPVIFRVLCNVRLLIFKII